MAGLFDIWTQGAESLVSCTILTVPANELIKPIHEKNRMPAILGKTAIKHWLDPGTPTKIALDLCKPYATSEMIAYRINPRIGRVGTEGPDLIQSV